MPLVLGSTTSSRERMVLSLAQTSGSFVAFPTSWSTLGCGRLVPPQTSRPLIVPNPACAGAPAARVATGKAASAGPPQRPAIPRRAEDTARQTPQRRTPAAPLVFLELLTNRPLYHEPRCEIKVDPAARAVGVSRPILPGGGRARKRECPGVAPPKDRSGEHQGSV